MGQPLYQALTPDQKRRWPPSRLSRFATWQAEHVLGATIFAHACTLGFEGIVSKHYERPHRSEH
jgi:hypothetical protein